MNCFSLIFSILIILIKIKGFDFVENNVLKTEIVKLTTMETDSFSVHYHHQDHCMRNPNYENLAVYSINFYIKAGYFCDGLLICYPGQLDRSFKKRGLVINNDYRVKNTKKNNVGNMCEIKRKEYCNSGKGIDGLCRLASDIPSSFVPWHGIYIHRTAADGNKTKMVSSIFDMNYNIGSEEQFSITIGEKEFTTKLIVIEKEGLAMNKYSVDVEHKRKFFEEMKWAPFNVSRLFSAHSTFWMLGYDILSKEMDNILSFYVDRGCNCPMKVWFTREEKISRKSKEMLNKWFEITEFGNSKCPKTRTEETYNLIGNIEIEINFKIFINNVNATATFKLYNNERSIGIYVYEDRIVFEKNDVNGDWAQSKIDILPNKNIMKEGMTLNIKIKLFKFYCEFNIGNETKTFTNKFWYNKWWNGKKYLTYKKLEVFGDFIRVNAITETENEKIHQIKLPHSNRIFNNFMTNGSIATIRVQIKEKAQNFQLLLLHDSPEFNLNIGATVMSINVNYKRNIINLTSFSENNYHNNATIQGANIYSRGKPIQITIKMQNIIKKEEKIEFYNIYINDKECHSYIGGFPFWSTNWIQVKGDAVLLEEPFITSPKLHLKETEKIYKHELNQLPFIGSTFCLEGTLPQSSDVEGIEKLEISLMHESNDESERFGDTLLKMEFQFSTEHGESWLKISSRLYKQREINEKKYANPIGLSSVELTVRINVEESYFKIRFNDGKTFIKYNYVAPPWMVNWIVVKGNIDNVKFGNEAKRCLQYISKPLPPHITKIENLKEGQYISVKGTVTKLDENILINFYYGALGWDEERGRVVLQAKITNQNIFLCTKNKKEHHCDNVKNLPQKLKTGQIINMVFLATETKFEIYYDDQEIYQFELPLWAIQYVEVTGPLAIIEGRERIAEIRK